MKKLVAATIALGGVMTYALTGYGATSLSSDSQPILVGLIAGTTGAYGTTGVATVNGAKLAVAKINAEGGVLGRKVKLEWYNDNASATLSAQLFQKLVSAGAVAIIGSPDTGPTTAALSGRYKIPDIGDVDDGGLTVYPNGPSKPPLPWVFDFGLNTFAWGGIIGQYAAAHNMKMAILHDPTTYGQGGDYGIRGAYAAAGKSKDIVLDDTITENWSTGATTNLSSEIQKIKASGATAVDVWLTPQDQAAFVQEAHTLGAKFTIFGNDETNSDNTYASLAGSLANGTISASLTSEVFPSAGLKVFQRQYKKTFHLTSTPFAETTYDAVMMLAQVIKQTKSTNPEVLQRAFNSVRNFKGITGTLGFTVQNHTTISQNQLTLVRYNASTKTWVPIRK
ncbi:MAG: ABC transporter substrate-binding protein [Alicyclobacillus sp.]|nr:ABC transporter substrate-binding protein [Alicyclobacillus sp.]